MKSFNFHYDKYLKLLQLKTSYVFADFLALVILVLPLLAVFASGFPLWPK